MFQLFQNHSAGNKKKPTVLMIALLIVVSAIAGQIEFSNLLGTTDVRFTLLHMIAPAIAGIYGIGFAILGLAASFVLSLVLGKALTFTALAFLLPSIAGVWYFRTKFRFAPIVALIAMAVFFVHPSTAGGREYALFWLIPLLTSLVSKRSTYMRALGATFTQHAVGGIIFLALFPSSGAFWTMLIPFVILERMIISSGIVLSYAGVLALQKSSEEAYEFDNKTALEYVEVR